MRLHSPYEAVSIFVKGNGPSSFAPRTNVKGTFVRGANDDVHKFTAWDFVAVTQGGGLFAVGSQTLPWAMMFNPFRVIPLATNGSRVQWGQLRSTLVPNLFDKAW